MVSSNSSTSTNDNNDRMLWQDLPNGQFYDGRPPSDMEAQAIEDLRIGYFTVLCSVPMREFLAIMKTRLGTDDMPDYIAWARLRYHLQKKCLDYLLSLSFPDLDQDEPVLLRPGPLAREQPRESDLYADALPEGSDWDIYKESTDLPTEGEQENHDGDGSSSSTPQ